MPGSELRRGHSYASSVELAHDCMKIASQDTDSVASRRAWN